MQRDRLGQFTTFESDVFASFVADLFERAGYDCRLVTPASDGGPNVVADREGGGRLRIAALATGDVDDIGAHVGRHGSAVDIVVIPQATAPAHLRLVSDVELFDGDRLTAFVEELGAETLVDDYLLGRSVARDRVDRRRADRATGHGPTPAGNSAPTEPQGDPDFSRGHAYTLIVVGIAGLCFGTSLAESVGGGLATVALSGSYALLVGGLIVDARSLRYRTLDGIIGILLTGTLGILLFFALSEALLGSVAGVCYLANRWRLERATAPETEITWAPLGRTRWYWLVVAGTIGWALAFLGALTGGLTEPTTFVVAMGSWLAVPVGLIVDGRHDEQQPSTFTRRFLTLVALVPPLGALVGLVYTLSRNEVRAEQRQETYRESLPSVSAIRLPSGLALTNVRAALRSIDDTARQSLARDEHAGSARNSKEPPRGHGPAQHGHGVAGPTDGGRQQTADPSVSNPETADAGTTLTTDTTAATATDVRPGSEEEGAPDTVAVDGDTDGGGAGDAPLRGYTLGPPVVRLPRESRTISYEGTEFRCTSVASRNGRWRVAWGAPAGDDTGQRVFLLQYEARQLTVEAMRVSECVVGDDGTVAIVESDGEGVSRLRVLSATGVTVLDRGLDGEVRTVAVAGADEPTLVGVGVRTPHHVVVFDVAAGETCLDHRLDVEPDAIEFRARASDRWVVINGPAEPTPDLAVRVRDATVVRG